MWWLLWMSILWYLAFCIKHLRNLRIFFHHGHSSLAISVLNIAATASFVNWGPVMTKGMSRFPNNYVSPYILYTATLVYEQRSVQEYVVTTLIAACASHLFFLGYYITEIVLRPFSFLFFLTLYLENKRNKLQVIEIKPIHVSCISLMTGDKRNCINSLTVLGQL